MENTISENLEKFKTHREEITEVGLRFTKLRGDLKICEDEF